MIKLFFFLLFNLISTGFSNEKIKLIIHPQVPKTNQPEGHRFLLTCAGENEEPALFTNLKWIDPKGQEINDNNEFHRRNYIVKNTKDNSVTLNFINPTETLSGNYTCKSFFQNVEELSNSINVTFFQDITWEDCPSTQYLTKGDKESIIRCRITAKPAAEITWTKDGKELPNKYERTFNGIIVHGIVNEDIEGRYDVEASVIDTGSVKQNSIFVKIHVKPDIIKLQPVFEVVEDEVAQLSCKATGVPLPEYYWLDSNKRNLSSVGGYNVNKNTGDLIISRVNKLQDQGNFICITENSAGIASKNTYLNVLSKPRIISFNNISSEVGSRIIFACTVNGNPPPQVIIRKDGELNYITSGGNYNIEELTSNSETKLILTINNIQRIDDGLYYCIATNKIGKIDSVGHLQVEYKPDLSNTPLNVKTWSNRNVNISCVVKSIPNATVYWYFKNSQIYDNEYYSIINTDFFGVNYLLIKPGNINNREIYGQYTCLAKNKHGESSVFIKLTEAYKPTMPTYVDLSDDSPNSITVKFVNPIHTGGLPIKKVLIKYRESNESFDNAKIKEFQFDKDYILTGLIPKKTYLLNFAAENDVGLSDYTQDFQKLMPHEKPPNPPVILYSTSSDYNYFTRPLESLFSDRFDIRWSTPNDNGRKIELYNLKYYLVVRAIDKWNRIGDIKELYSGPNDQLIHHLSDLKPNSTYEVELRAKNFEGYSQPFRLVFRTSSYVSGSSYFQEKVSKAITDLTIMTIIIFIIIIISLILLDIILYVRYNYGVLYYLIHICISDKSNHKVKNVETNNTGYSYHCPNDEIRPMMLDKNARNEFKTELENRLRMPKNSAV